MSVVANYRTAGQIKDIQNELQNEVVDHLETKPRLNATSKMLKVSSFCVRNDVAYSVSTRDKIEVFELNGSQGLEVVVFEKTDGSQMTGLRVRFLLAVFQREDLIDLEPIFTNHFPFSPPELKNLSDDTATVSYENMKWTVTIHGITALTN